MKIYEGKLVSEGVKVGIVVARFNEFITSKLLAGAIDISSGWVYVDPWCDRYAGTGYRGSGASALQYGHGF